jgi:hypothetical protein
MSRSTAVFAMIQYTYRDERGQYSGVDIAGFAFCPRPAFKFALRVVRVAGGFGLERVRRKAGRGVPVVWYQPLTGVYSSEKLAEDAARKMMMRSY